MCPKASIDRMPKAKVMICEDEPIVALDLQMLVEGFGYEVMGLYASVEKALEALDGARPDAAVLDVNLRDGTVFPVAERLHELGAGLVFHSGHAFGDEITQRWPDASCCEKPIDTLKLEQELERVATSAVNAG